MRKPMPISRDTSVRNHDIPGSVSIDKVKGAEIAGSKASPCLVTVMGFSNNDVLFRSNDANIVQWRDSSGEIVALLIRLKPDIWGFSKRGDDDWNEILAIYGNKDQN